MPPDGEGGIDPDEALHLARETYLSYDAPDASQNHERNTNVTTPATGRALPPASPSSAQPSAASLAASFLSSLAGPPSLDTG